MTDDLTLKERQNIQDALEATKKGAITNYRRYVEASTHPTAGVPFAKEILECEILMKFNAAAIKEAQATTAQVEPPKQDWQLHPKDYWSGPHS